MNTLVQRNMSYHFLISYIWGDSHDALRGSRVPMINVRAVLITATRRAFAAVELMLCVRVMAQEVLFP